MDIYNFNKETKEFISKTVATESPLEKGVFLIPANATIIKPLDTKENFAVCFNKDKQEWEYKEDNRNKTVYSTITKETSIVDYLGTIKDGFTLSVPTEFDKWENNSWVKDIEVIKASKLLSINTECNKAIISGFKSSALGEEYFYYSTIEEQSTLTSLITLGIDSNFKCQKINIVDNVEVKENRVQVPHTLAQLKQVLTDGAIHIKAQIDRKDELEALINSQDITIEELELIEW